MVSKRPQRRPIGRYGVVGEEARDDLLSQLPCSGIGLCIRWRSSSLISRSFALMRSRRDFP